MRWIANLCYLIAGVLYTPVLLYQMILQGKNRRDWWQRFGHLPQRQGDRPCIWIHAVSLGEINATRTLVKQIQTKLTDVELVISTTTDTGYARAKQLYPELMIFRYPLDFSWMANRVLRRIRPTMIVLMELEVWYNLVTLATARGIKVCVANGRFTARSFKRLRLTGPWGRQMFSCLSWVGAQTEEIASRFREMGAAADRVEVVGSMKWDTADIAEHITGQENLAAAMGIQQNEQLIVLGSSGPGEEEQAIAAWSSLPTGLNGARLAIVPRKPERFDEVAKLIERTGKPYLRRSELPDGSTPPAGASKTSILLGDTMGELRKLYSLADVVIVGRTLVPLGGSDPMEVAALGKAIIVGPHTENFVDPVARLQQAQAIAILNKSQELAEQLAQLLRNEHLRREMGRRARQVVRDNQGATGRTLAAVQQLLT